MALADTVSMLQTNQSFIQSNIKLIADAIQAKGVSTSNQPLSNFPALISAIQTDDSPTATAKVQIVDYDGTIVSTQFVSSLSQVQYPTLAHPFPFSAPIYIVPDELAEETIIGITYTSQDTIIVVTPIANNLDISLNIKGSATIDWGDGTVESTSSPSNHTYASAGQYNITISGGPVSFGSTGASIVSTTDMALINTIIFGDNVTSFTGIKSYGNLEKVICHLPLPTDAFASCSRLKAFISNTTTVGAAAFQNSSALQYVITPNLTSIAESCYYNCFSLKYVYPHAASAPANAFFHSYGMKTISVPDETTSIGNSFCESTYSLQEFNFPSQLTTIGSRAFYSNYSLYTINIPATVTSIGDAGFQYNTNLRTVVMNSEIPPTITAYTFGGVSTFTKFYIPDDFLPAYKIATNWIALTSRMLPMSQLPV